MSEEPDNLVLQPLRAIRVEMSRMSGAIETLGAEMRAMRQLLAGVITLQDHDHGDIADRKHRVDRIEKRLELTD